MPEKPLKIWNGRAHGQQWDRGHFYVCAKSRRAAARLLCLASHPSLTPDARDIGQMDRELRDYYSPDCWGNTMKGITPEVGVWATRHFTDKPTKIV